MNPIRSLCCTFLLPCTTFNNNNNNNNNNNLFIYSALFNILGDQKRITTINNLKTIQILEIYKYI